MRRSGERIQGLESRPSAAVGRREGARTRGWKDTVAPDLGPTGHAKGFSVLIRKQHPNLKRIVPAAQRRERSWGTIILVHGDEKIDKMNGRGVRRS